ncbi:hypothetical protein N7508_006484 [Penicillium antarcticum]|uniref:uncharacterized protein n=1 Tax=Penicillium antarcticum TaxID=416450 RepID=UPI00238457C6|nr:uncharacterized protein N7508_006484 [Penicillium antarcticum]KAJ5301621.1 hypothetical protein N7508_006484 [Penicillium antarcticum]
MSFRTRRGVTPLVQASRVPNTPSRPVNSNPTTPAIEAKRIKRPRYNTKERARRVCTWSEDSNGKALPRCDDCTNRNKKCSDIPFSTEILDRYLAALADTSPAIDIAPINGPRADFLKAMKRYTQESNRAAKDSSKETTLQQGFSSSYWFTSFDSFRST